MNQPSFRYLVLSHHRSFTTNGPLFSRIGMKPIPFDPNLVQFHFNDPYSSPLPDAPVPRKYDFDRRKPYHLTVQGPLGELKYPIKACVRLNIIDNPKFVSTPSGLNNQEKTEENEEDDADEHSFWNNNHNNNNTNESILPKCVRIQVDFPTTKRERTIWGTTRAMIANLVHGVTQGYTWKLKLVGVGYRASLSPQQEALLLNVGYANVIQLNIPPSLKVTCPSSDSIEVFGLDKREVSQFAATIRKHRPPEPYNQKGIFVNDETIMKKKSKK